MVQMYSTRIQATVRIAECFEPHHTRFWDLLRQVGIDGAISELDAAEDQPWGYSALHRMKRRYEAAGFELLGIDDYPPLDKARLGLPGGDQEIEDFCTMVRNMGRLEIPLLSYDWMPVVNWLRTDPAHTARGGARVSAFRRADIADAGLTAAGRTSPEQTWKAWEHFIGIVAPVAEKSGVRLALHPDDPPIPEVRGIARIMHSLESYERAMGFLESESNAMCLCQGNFTLFCDDVPAAIRHFGAKGHIAYGHFRDVEGTADDFVETFHDQGMTDKVACMEAWHAVGRDVVIRPDHVPTLEGESNDAPGSAWLARLHAVGYLQGLRAAALHPRAGAGA